MTVGYVSGAYGVHGWVRIKPYSADADALLNVRRWWLGRADAAGECTDVREVEMLQAKLHSGDVVASLMGVAGRDAAEALKGEVVQVSRSHFPALSTGEFYWIDLIGLIVENIQGEQLGVVADMMDNGAHPILRIAPLASAEPDRAPTEILIPFVDHFIKSVEQAEKKIVVDWDRDY